MTEPLSGPFLILHLTRLFLSSSTGENSKERKEHCANIIPVTPSWAVRQALPWSRKVRGGSFPLTVFSTHKKKIWRVYWSSFPGLMHSNGVSFCWLECAVVDNCDDVLSRERQLEDSERPSLPYLSEILNIKPGNYISIIFWSDLVHYPVHRALYSLKHRKWCTPYSLRSIMVCVHISVFGRVLE